MISVMTEKKTIWLSRRLKELGKTKAELAEFLKCHPARFTELEKDEWKFQTNQIKPTADFLKFDRVAFLDFLSGEITEEQLWNTKPIILTEQDKAILSAIKTATNGTTSQSSSENIQSLSARKLSVSWSCANNSNFIKEAV